MDSHKIDQLEFAVFDTETTGLEPDLGDRIIEIACVKMKGSQIQAEFHSLVNPNRQITEEALQVHHISNEMLLNAPSMNDVMPKFLDFIRGNILCAYNVAFDLGFIKKELSLLEQEFPKDINIIDLLTMARKLLPGLERYSLLYVSNHLGIKREQFHRALSDVYMAIEVFNKLKELLKAKGIEDVISFQSLFGLNSPYLNDIRNQKMSCIQEAMELGVKLKIKYISSQNAEVTEREVIPRQIRQENNKYYLIGYCSLRNAERIFSVDGILNLEIL